MPFDPNSPFCQWTRNVIDEFKSLSDEDIRQRLIEKSNEFAVLMTHVEGDFNIGTAIRSANFHGAREFFYYGRRKMDRRGAVGTYKYTSVTFLESLEKLLELKRSYTLIGFENNLPGTVNLHDFNWKLDKPPCIVVGEECNGIPAEILDLCDSFVEIPSFGSVRSMNVGSAASIAMYDYVSKKRRMS